MPAPAELDLMLTCLNKIQNNPCPWETKPIYKLMWKLL